MPTNVTAQYRKAEEAYRRAGSPEEELDCLQLMLREVPKHKGTENLQADIKQKISKLKRDLVKQKSSGGARGSFRLPRQGAGRAVLIGGPNSGKSQLLAALTRATPEIAPYPFTTHAPLPGMMPWEDVMVQLIDTPPITADVLAPETQALIRGSDVVLLVADMGDDDGSVAVQEVVDHLHQGKTRLGIESHFDEADVGVVYTRTFLVPNKMDLPEATERLELLHEFCPLDFPEFPVSAISGEGLEPLRNAIYHALDVVRVYTKMPSQKDADFDKPYTIRRGGTLLEVAQMVHKDFAENLKFARVWGTAVHPGTQVKGDYELHDKDIVELHQ